MHLTIQYPLNVVASQILVTMVRLLFMGKLFARSIPPLALVILVL